MTSNTFSRFLSKNGRARAAGCVLAAAVVLCSAIAAAQDASKDAAKPAPRPQQEGFFGTMSRWWNQSTETWNSGVSDARKRFENLGAEAGVAARTTVDNAKNAADAVARLPSARVVRGHEKCKNAPNGAPDCVSATVALCKSKGFDSGGSSLDMTTAEVCPAQVYLSGRSDGEGCHTETFVSRVLCQ
jgi:uncharacterized protein YdeI (BOF family)